MLLTDDLSQQDKLVEIEKFQESLKSFGASFEPIPEDAQPISLIADVINQLNVLWDKKNPDNDVFGILGRLGIFIGLILEFENGVDGDINQCDSTIKHFCDKMREAENEFGRGRVTTRVLYDMFHYDYPVNSKAKYSVYVAWLMCCSKKNATYLLELQKTKIDKLIEKWEAQLAITDVEIRKIRRAYQMALQRLERYEEAATAMEFLLQSHPDVTNEEAVKDAQDCILQSLTTPSQFRFDHLREIAAIENLKATPYGELLDIFIEGTVDEYDKFAAANDLKSLGFSDGQILVLKEKMKLLTLIALAQKSPDVLYKTVEEKLNLDEEDCEDLAVKAFQLKLLRGRLDQGNERISTTYAIKRDFAPSDWQNLKDKVGPIMISV
jgi:hypothetical protein